MSSNATRNPIELLPPDEPAPAVVAKFFRGRADPSQLRLLQFLLAEDHTVSECVQHLGLAPE